MGDGATQRAALVALGDAIALQVGVSLEHGNPSNLFKPADRRLFAMFAAGRDLTEGDLHVQQGSATIDQIGISAKAAGNRSRNTTAGASDPPRRIQCDTRRANATVTSAQTIN